MAKQYLYQIITVDGYNFIQAYCSKKEAIKEAYLWRAKYGDLWVVNRKTGKIVYAL